MSSVATTSLAEKVRAAVACFRASEPGHGKVYVLLEAPEVRTAEGKPLHRAGIARLAARRIYAGEHKNLEGRWTVVVGHDLAEPAAAQVALTVERTFEVSVRGAPFAEADAPFEGVFDLRTVELDKR